MSNINIQDCIPKTEVIRVRGHIWGMTSVTKGTVLMDNVYRKGDEGIIEQICSYRNEDKLLIILLISLCVTKKNYGKAYGNQVL